MSITKISTQVKLACGHTFGVDTYPHIGSAAGLEPENAIATTVALQAFQLKQWAAEHTPEVCADTRVEQRPAQSGGVLEVGGEADQSERA